MKVFSAKTVAGSITFVGETWEEGGFTEDDGGPVCDVRGNSVRSWDVCDINSEHAHLMLKAYTGDDEMGDIGNFLDWLTGECGLGVQLAAAICIELGLNPSLKDWGMVAKRGYIFGASTEAERLLRAMVVSRE